MKRTGWPCSFHMCGGVAAEAPNQGLELTASSVRSCLAPAASSSSGLAFGCVVIGKLEVFMFVFKQVPKNLIAATLVVMTAHCLVVSQSLAQIQPISIFIVRHAEADGSQLTIPLTAAGRQRADLLVHTLRGVKFTHIFTTHTTRTRQMVEGIAVAQGVPIVQLPVPGSMLDGQSVTDQTSRRAPIEPISTALL